MQRYIVQSSDVLQDLRINVCEERSGQVIWYKERYLTEKEIVENVVHNATSTVLWSIHRPKRGWYIRIRAPTFPPEVFIHLKPSASWADSASLSFAARTTIPTSITDIPNSSTSTVHSYPPTPPALSVNVQPPSPTEVSQRLEEQQSSSNSKKPHRPPPSQITQFVLSPTLGQTEPDLPADAGIFSRAMALWTRTTSAAVSQGNSFSLLRVVVAPTTVGGGTVPDTSKPPSRPSLISANSTSTILAPGSQPPLIPVLKYTDRTPVYSMSSQTGLLEMDMQEEKILGIDTAFWVVVSLAYVSFLNDRDSYLAAIND
ncbi:hypothetical protein DL96DRAFT_1586638 [Flagelloscypha sp. PMI_526]|nr:hypothetical protein DL96DRAFT_1586638 [Flagelloscypha sp. PMI_526]